MAPREAAVVTVPARLALETLMTEYGNVGQFEIPSEAEIAHTEEGTTNILGAEWVKVRSRARPMDPTVSLGK